MPTYEYACGACGHQWEQVQRIIEAPIEVCPKCAQSAAHRLISGGTNFILKGGGWYSDLYSSSKPGAKAPAENGSPAPAAATSESSSSSSSSKGESAGAKSESKAAPAASSTPSTPSTPSSAPSSS